LKDYSMIQPSVKRGLEFHNEEWVMGYIMALWDWRVISKRTYEKLEEYIKRGGEKN